MGISLSVMLIAVYRRIVHSMKNKWFKHYNSAHEGELIGNLIAQKRYDCVALWWILLEFMSRFEDENNRGKLSIPLIRISRAINMKPTRTYKLLTHISFVSHSRYNVEMDAKLPGNVVFLIPNWLELQENRGGKKVAKLCQNFVKNSTEVRSKKEEVRSKNKKEDIYSSEFLDRAKKTIQKLNELCGTHFQPSAKSNITPIIARLKENPEICDDDVVKIIQIKNRQWKDDPKMSRYLRPETLFNATKFQAYFSEMKAIEERIKFEDRELWGINV